MREFGSLESLFFPILSYGCRNGFLWLNCLGRLSMGTMNYYDVVLLPVLLFSFGTFLFCCSWFFDFVSNFIVLKNYD